MNITHNKGTNYITFKPFGTFTSKLRSILKVIHYKLYEDNKYYIFERKRKTKREKHFKTYIPTLLAKPHNNIMVIFKFKKSAKNRLDSNDENPDNFYYRNFSYTFEYGKKQQTTELIIKNSLDYLTEHMNYMMDKFGEDYELASFHSMIIKFI
jgi:hypothetical protein